MTPRQTSRLGVWLGLLAFGGLIGGHYLGYLVAAPDAHARADLLAATGHRSHDVLMSLGAAAVIAAVVDLVFRHLRGTAASERSPAGVLRAGATLWILQSVGFTALETFERGGLGHAAHLLHEPAFLLGLAAQLVVALLALALVWLLGVTVEALLRLLTRPASEPVSIPNPIVSAPHPRVAVARRAWNLRGPPRTQLFAS